MKQLPHRLIDLPHLAMKVYNEHMTNKMTLIAASGIVSVLIIGALVIHQDVSKAFASTGFPKNERIGVWDWAAPDTTSSSEKQQVAAALKARGITEVYVDITSYNDDSELSDPIARKTKITEFTNALRETARYLHADGIAVHALAGNSHWANPDYSYIPLKLLDFVAAYNQAASDEEKLAGMQFDIEFYNDKDFKYAPLAYTQQFLNLTQMLANERSLRFENDSQFTLGFAISAAMDGSDPSYIPNVPQGDAAAKPPLSILLDQLKGGFPAYMAVMAYRNKANKTIERVQTEMEMASNYSNIKVLVGEETTKVSPKSLTFYSQSLTDLQQMTASVQATFSANYALGGYAINDQDGFLKLKD